MRNHVVVSPMQEYAARPDDKALEFHLSATGSPGGAGGWCGAAPRWRGATPEAEPHAGTVAGHAASAPTPRPYRVV